MDNKPIQVTKSSMPLFEEYIKEIEGLWDSHWLTNSGVKHVELENSLVDYLSVRHISLFSNGHLALETIIDVMGLTGEVITTPFTFVSTTHAIVRNNLTPVFCDINPLDYTIDVTQIESLITEKTSAIIPVHVYGNVCNVEEIERLAKKHNLKVIYDAAHAFGVTHKGRGIASYGDVSMFSFHATKVFNTIEGGCLAFGESRLKPKIDAYKNFGLTGQESVEFIGTNSKMNEFQAAMGICNLRYIDSEIEKRREVVNRYIQQLTDVEGIRLALPNDDVASNYSYFPVVFDGFKKTRDQVFEQLKDHQIFARKYFYPLTTQFECYKGQFESINTPVAKYISERILTLPLYADLALEDVNRICDIIKQ